MTDADAIWKAKQGIYECRCCGAVDGVNYLASTLCRSCWLSFETQNPPLGSAADVAEWLDRRRRKLEGR